jgi:hypothetical protein
MALRKTDLIGKPAERSGAIPLIRRMMRHTQHREPRSFKAHAPRTPREHALEEQSKRRGGRGQRVVRAVRERERVQREHLLMGGASHLKRGKLARSSGQRGSSGTRALARPSRPPTSAAVGLFVYEQGGPAHDLRPSHSGSTENEKATPYVKLPGWSYQFVRPR